MLNQETLDLRGIPCPANAARALLALEMSAADTMQLHLDDGEAIVNVRESVTTANFVIVNEKQEVDSSWTLTVNVTPG